MYIETGRTTCSTSQSKADTEFPSTPFHQFGVLEEVDSIQSLCARINLLVVI